MIFSPLEVVVLELLVVEHCLFLSPLLFKTMIPLLAAAVAAGVGAVLPVSIK
jgi:hypothetical protein